MNYPVSRRPSIIKRYETPNDIEVTFTSNDDKGEILKRLKNAERNVMEMSTKSKKSDLWVPDCKRKKVEEKFFDAGEDTSYTQYCDNKGCAFYKKVKCESFGTQCFGYIEPDEKSPT